MSILGKPVRFCSFGISHRCGACDTGITVVIQVQMHSHSVETRMIGKRFIHASAKPDRSALPHIAVVLGRYLSRDQQRYRAITATSHAPTIGWD